jgi:hypothetical protein
MPCEFLVDNRRCRILTKGSLCHVHQRSSKLLKKMTDQKIELNILNKRLSESMRKLRIIDECDRVKFELMQISSHCSFRTSITKPDNKAIVEKIFNVPFDKCITAYDELLNQRNQITHKYTMKTWEPKNRKFHHNRTLAELYKSLPKYQQ